MGATEDSSAREETHRTTAVATRLEESTVLHGKVLELRSDVLVRSQGAAKDTQLLLLIW